MHGNLISNSLIFHLIRSKDIQITPFDAKELRTAHYPLRAHAVLEWQGERWRQSHSFEDGPFEFAPNQYVLVEVSEQILLSQGIIGKFVAASNLIEQAIGLTAGRVEHPFGQNGEWLRFGLKNLVDRPTRLMPSDYVCYVEFYDLRGLRRDQAPINPRDKRVFETRVNEARLLRAQDSGVFYEDEDEPK